MAIISSCVQTFIDLNEISIGDIPPISPSNNQLWFCTKNNGTFLNNMLYKYNSSVKKWEIVNDYTDEILEAIKNLNVTSRNLLSDTAVSKDLICTGIVNQCGAKYGLVKVVDYAKHLKNNKLTYAFDWEYIGNSPSGTFVAQTAGPQWTQVSKTNTISASNYWGTCVNTITFTSENSFSEIGIRADNVVGTIKITHPRLVFGEKDLGWTQAPEDLEEKFTTIFDRTDKGIYMEHAGEGTTGLIDVNNKAVKISAPSLFLEGYTTINEHFKVLPTGDIEGTNAKFNGTITSGGTISGTAISGGTLTGSTIQNAINNPTFKVTPTGAMTASNATIKGTISGSIISGETFTSANNKFKVLGNGTLEATEANITGAISAGSTITGSTVIGSTIQNAATNPTFVVSNTGNIKGAVIVGSSFQNAELNPTFKVDTNGRVDASNMNITGGSLNVGSNFNVSNTGILTAKSANFTGSINAGSTITGSIIQNAISNPTFKIDANGNITGGSININNAFSVSSAGKLIATSAEISGKVTIGSGSTVPTSYLSGTVSSSQLDKTITNDISTAKTDSSNAAAAANKATELATALSKGKMLNTDPNFRNGLNGISVYNNTANNTLTITKINKLDGCPTTSDFCAEIKVVGDTSPGRGGFTFRTSARANAIFITRFIAKIPEGYTVNFGTNALGNGYQGKWFSPTAGTGKWEEYIYCIKCGSDGTFSNTNFYNLTGGSIPTAENPLIWHLAYATVFDVTDNDERVTILNSKSEGWDTVKNTVDSNKVNWSVAYKQIESWAEATPTGTTEFDGNKIKTGTIFANKMAIGDFTNICQIDENRNPIIFPKILNTDTTEVVTYTDSRKYFKFGHTSTQGYYGLILINDMQIIKTGDVFRFNCIGFSTSNSIRIAIRATYTDGSYTDLGANGVSATSKVAPINTVIKIVNEIDSTKTIRDITCFIYNTNVVGLTYLRSISINRMSTGELIVDGSITSNMIHTDGLDANTIKAGTLDVARIAANSITVDKVAIGDFTNYCNKPTNYVMMNGAPAWRVSNNQPLISTNLTQLKGGEKFNVSGRVYGASSNTANAILRVEFVWRNSSSSAIVAEACSCSVSVNATIDINETISIPARPDTASFGNFKCYVLDTTQTVFWFNPNIRLMMTGELVVDGAITGDKIAANSITANNITVGDGVANSGNLASGLTTSGATTSTICTDGQKAIGTSYMSFGSGSGTNNSPERDYIQLDLGAIKIISESRVYYFSADNRYYFYKIKYSSDGTNWYYAIGKSSNNGWMTSTLATTTANGFENPTINSFSPAISARYIRLYTNGNTINSGNHIYEWELYSQSTTQISGNQITTGKLTSLSGGSYLDLNNGSMMLGSTSNANYLQWTGSSLNIKADSLSLKTGGTVATINDVDGLQLKFAQSGNCNEIYNGNFKNGLAQWRNSGSNIIVNDVSCPTNSTALKMVGVIGATKQVYQQLYSVENPMNFDKPLTISMWAYVSSSGTDGTTNKYIGYQVTVTYTDGTKAYPGGLFNNGYDGWVRYSKTLVPTTGKKIQYLSIDLITRDNTRTCYITDVILTKGDAEVPFSSNPNEIYDGIVNVDKDGIMVTASNANTKTIMNTDGFFLKRTDNRNIFKVDSTGLEMTGTVNATSGTIGGFNIQDDSITGGNLGLTCPGTTGTDIAIWAGSVMPERAPLKIMHDGAIISKSTGAQNPVITSIQEGQFRSSISGQSAQIYWDGVNIMAVPQGTTDIRQTQMEYNSIKLQEVKTTGLVPSIKTHFGYEYDYDTNTGAFSVNGDSTFAGKIKADTVYTKAESGDTNRNFLIGGFGGHDIYGTVQGVAYLGNTILVYGSEKFEGVAADTTVLHTIKFRVPFSMAPFVSVTANTSAVEKIFLGATAVSSTQFSLQYRRTNTTATTIFWCAIGQRG